MSRIEIFDWRALRFPLTINPIRRGEAMDLRYLWPGMVLALVAEPAAAWQAAAGADGWARLPALPGGVRLRGLLDAYYSLNFNHPASQLNRLRNFDLSCRQFSLNLARLSLEREPAPFGFHLDAGYGQALQLTHSASDQPPAWRYLPQAMVSFQPDHPRRIRLDFGKFATWAGAEVIETHRNWNYSRSLLFSYAVPYHHFGLRASGAVAKYVTGGVQLVSGWNNLRDRQGGETVGLTAAFSRGALSLNQTYYVGPDSGDVPRRRRSLYDATLLVSGLPRVSFYVNGDYGRRSGPAREAAESWAGVAGAARVSLPRGWAVSPRLEWFRDQSGIATGVAQRLKEATLTAEWMPNRQVLARLEYRYDSSDQPVFDRGPERAAARRQRTVLVGLIFLLGDEP